MKNLTLSIDDAVLEDVCAIAARNQTTVNAMVRDYLAKLAGEEARILEARKGLLDLMETSTGRLGADYRWNREELYDQRKLP